VIVKHNRRHQRLVALLSRERAQTVPDYALALSVISGTSVLAAFPGLSDGTASAITGVVRLFV
jgi:hypothetical protein